MAGLTIELNKTVILQKGEVFKAVKLIPKKTIVFEKVRFQPDKAAGEKFGTTFKACNGELIAFQRQHITSSECEAKISVTSGVDNRKIFDSHGEAQTLKRELIVEMKEKGATGEQIIENLVSNSSSFSGKTKYSQNKYVKKKQKKHLNYIMIHKPTARLLFKLYQGREPAKICQMKFETMSQILLSANVQYGSRVAMFETCSGVLLGMVAERVGCQGRIVNLHVGETPSNLFAMSHLNMSDEQWATINSLPMHCLGPLLAGKALMENDEESPQQTTTTTASPRPVSDGEPTSLKRKQLSDEEKQAIRSEKRQRRLMQQKKAWDLLHARQMDALIIASRFHPSSIFLPLLETLAYSKPFVVYCEYREPLMELFVRLSVGGLAINLNIFDCFSRNYQVLPERTHPHVMLTSGGGHILTGIKVQPDQT